VKGRGREWHRGSYIPPRHRIPRGNIDKPTAAKRSRRERDVANIGYPQRREVAAHYPDLRRGREHGEPDHAEEEVQVPELQGDEAAAGAVGGLGGVGDLLGYEPVWGGDGAEEAGDAVCGVLGGFEALVGVRPW
jgi:hypothetical protein